jgi:hypothetical protein
MTVLGTRSRHQGPALDLAPGHDVDTSSEHPGLDAPLNAPLLALVAVLSEPPDPFQRAGPPASVLADLLDKDPATRLDAVGAHEPLRHVTELRPTVLLRLESPPRVLPETSEIMPPRAWAD